MSTYRRALVFVLLFAALGATLSGYLSYWNYFQPGCSQGPLNWLVSCGSGPTKVLIFGQPTCIYGFGMFLAVFIIGLTAAVKPPSHILSNTLITLGVGGVLFAGGLTIYELWFIRLTFTALPACVYGLLFYLGILVAAVAGRRGLVRQLNSTVPTDFSSTGM